MTPSTFDIGHDRLIAVPNTVPFFAITKTNLSSTDGAFDLMNALKRTFALFQQKFLKGQFDKYLLGCNPPRLAMIAIPFGQRMAQIHHEKLSLQNTVDVSHQTFDVGATFCYAVEFFSKAPARIILAGQVVFDALYDTTGILANVTHLGDLNRWQKEGKTAPDCIQKAIHNDRRHTVLSLAKTITAAVVSVFACLAFFFSSLTLPAMIALPTALISSIFAISAYYHQNYLCDLSLKIQHV